MGTKLSIPKKDNISSKNKNISADNFEPLWTVSDVAKYLRLEPETIRAMARDEKLPAIKLGRYWRFNRKQIQDWISRATSKNE